MTLTHGGLFEGYGGTSQAARLALGGLRTRWVSDIKPASIRLLEHHHPLVPNLGDLTQIDYSTVRPVDVLTASWPCQPHSSAGKRLGEKDPRALWPEVIRAITALRPAIFLGENVARIASNGELRRVVRTLADLGYVGAWRCVRASDVGAPHRRDRGFVVAVDPAAYSLGVLLRDEPGRGSGQDGEGAGVAGHDGAERSARLTLLPTPTQNMMTGAGTSGRDGGMNLQTAVTLLPTPTQRDGRRGKGWGDQPGRPLSETVHRVVDGWGEYGQAVTRWEAVLGRSAPDPTQPAVRAPHGPQLAPAFVEWMMGVDEGWVTSVPGLTRAQMLSLLGDGVVPQQGAHAYRFMLNHLAERLAGSIPDEEAA